MIEWYFIQMAIMLLSAYPLALLYTSIIAKHYQTHWRHLYSVVVSFLLYNALFPVHDFIQLLLLSTGVYYIITCSSKTSTLHSQRPNPWIPVTVFILSMSCLVLNHLAAQVWNHSTATIDATVPMMVLVIKLTSFAWSVHDGQVYNYNKTNIKDDEKKKLQSRHQIENRVTEMPGLLAFYGYVFFFGGFLIGPALKFHDYINFINRQAPFDKIPAGRTRAALECMGVAAICIFLQLIYEPVFQFQVAASEEFATSRSFWQRFWYVMGCGFFSRQKYFAAWKLSEGACIVAGIGYNGMSSSSSSSDDKIRFDSSSSASSPISSTSTSDPSSPTSINTTTAPITTTSNPNIKPKFDRMKNIDIMAFEFPPNARTMGEVWNINTGLWLRYSVYERLIGLNGGKATGLITMATFVTSAVWHGFHPGYYLFFATASVYNSAGRALRRGLRHYFVPPTPPASSTTTTTDPSSPPPRPPLLAPYKPIYDLIGTLLCMFFTNYIAAPFQVLTIQKSIRVWGSIYYIGHVGLLMIFIGLKALKRAFGGGGEGGGGRKSTTVKKNE